MGVLCGCCFLILSCILFLFIHEVFSLRISSLKDILLEKNVFVGGNSCKIVITKLFMFLFSDLGRSLSTVEFCRVSSVCRFSHQRNGNRYGVSVGYVSLDMVFSVSEIETETIEEEKELEKMVYNLSFPHHHSLLIRSRNILFIINPSSGFRKGKVYFEKYIKPMLLHSCENIRFDSVITKRGGEAFEIMSSLNFDKYNEVGVVGGDGTINEVISGLLNHKNLRKSLEIPISVFPLGTGNGVATEVGCENSVVMASLICLRGKTTKCDVASIFLNRKRYFSLLSIATCAVADVNGECKTSIFQTLGIAIRNISTTISCILKKRYYRTKIEYIYDEKESAYDIIGKYPKKFESIYISRNEKEEEEEDDDDFVIKCPILSTHFKKQMSELSPSGIFEKEDVFSKKKKTLKRGILNSEFFLLSFSNLKKLAYEIWGPGNACMNNGSWDIFSLENKLSSFHLLMEFLPLLGSNPSHMKSKNVRVVRCKAAYVQPLDGKWMNIDGESMEISPFLFEVQPRILSLMHI